MACLIRCGVGPRQVWCFLGLRCVTIWLNQISGTVVPSQFLSTFLVMPGSVPLSRDIEEIYHNLWRAEVRRDRDPTLALLHHRIVTCLVWALSGSSAVAEAYLLSKRVTDIGTTVEKC